ncbi:MAG: hypothetical protein LBS75_07565 [Synergistaceae bacterium]|jgi:Zn finger protein HypA/HybF involved in hydrogenase expression|nr:hypothetical protein [Synergistaceae bacterium]
MPLDLVKCVICGKAVVIERGTNEICPLCRSEEQRLYREVRSLILESAGKRYTISEVASELNVDEKKITHLVEIGYFQLVRSHVLLDYHKVL